jgi:Pregnancy-associated plasma protein-A/Secretion system C-terminal sorting domain/Fibronectin type III domain
MKLRQTLLALLLVCNTISFLSAQNRTCSAPEVLENLLKLNPEIQEQMNNVERHTQAFVQRNPSISERTVINIPVIVHVVYNAAAENISDAQVKSQIDVLNKDFRKLNVEAASIPSIFSNLAADVEINFCLATVTPTGTATNGIDRYRTSKTSWSTNDDMKRPTKDGVAAWDGTHYLNIWVCNLGSGSLGYSSFPGAPLITDGIVIDYRYFGTMNTRSPFNLGRTTTHEVGHWLNLFHIWGDSRCGNDHVDDTPLHHGANYGCPATPTYNSTCGNNIVEMTMNFMDYTNDACMAMFSNGQKARMRALFVQGGARYSFVESSLCGAVVTPPVCTFPTNISLLNIDETNAKITWGKVENARSYTIEYKANNASNWTTVNNVAVNTFNLSGLNSSTTYNFRVKTMCNTGGESEFSIIFNFTTNKKVVLPPTCSDNFESNNTWTTASPITTNRTEKAFIGVLGDRDWYSFKAEAGTSCSILLSNLPADYDFKLYDSRLRLLKSSENMGTANESISYTASKTDVFFIVVYGYNGAFDATNCYSFAINTTASSVNGIQKSDVNINGHQSAIENRFQNGLDTEGGLKVFPNPTSLDVAIQISPESESNATITLTNLSGQTVMTEIRWVSKTANIVKLDLSNMPSGLYFVTVRQDGQVWTKKLIKN